MQTVVETDEYLKDAKRAGLTDEEQAAIVACVAEHSHGGDEIAGTVVVHGKSGLVPRARGNVAVCG